MVSLMEPESGSPLRAGDLKTLLAYLTMIAATIIGFLGVRSLGADLHAPAPSGATAFGGSPASGGSEVFLHVLLALAAVILAARLLGAIFRRLRQPPVIGEVIAGILLGPSFLGRIAPAAAAFVLPASVEPFLGLLAQVGVVLAVHAVFATLLASTPRREGTLGKLRLSPIAGTLRSRQAEAD